MTDDAMPPVVFPEPTKGGALLAQSEVRISWEGLNDDADKLSALATEDSLSVARATVALSRSLMEQGRNGSAKAEMGAKLVVLHGQGDLVTDRLLAIQGFRVMRSLVGQGRFTAEIKGKLYVVE